VARLQDENAQLKRARLENVTTLLRTQQLEAENERLRKLLGVKERQQAGGQLARFSIRRGIPIRGESSSTRGSRTRWLPVNRSSTTQESSVR
jgi:hypothetical protein